MKKSFFVAVLAVILMAIATIATAAENPQPLKAEVYSLELHYGVGWIATARMDSTPDNTWVGENITLYKGGKMVGHGWAKFNAPSSEYGEVTIYSDYFEWNPKKHDQIYPVEFHLLGRDVVITGWKM